MQVRFKGGVQNNVNKIKSWKWHAQNALSIANVGAQTSVVSTHWC